MTFEEWWATKEAKGYRYGADALENVRLGYEGGQRARTEATPFLDDIKTIRSRDVHAIGAAISRCSLEDVEEAYNQLRDRLDRVLMGARTEATKTEPVIAGDRSTHWYACPHCLKPIDPPQPASTEAEPRPTDDALWDKTLADNERYHEIADQLAAQIAAITGEEIGEHSSSNDPWRNAMLSADEFIAKQIRALCRAHFHPEAPADDAVRDELPSLPPLPEIDMETLTSRMATARRIAEWGTNFATAAVIADRQRTTPETPDEVIDLPHDPMGWPPRHGWDTRRVCELTPEQLQDAASRARTTPETPTDAKAVELPPLPMLPIVVSHPGAIYAVMQQYARNAVALNARAES